MINMKTSYLITHIVLVSSIGIIIAITYLALIWGKFFIHLLNLSAIIFNIIDLLILYVVYFTAKIKNTTSQDYDSQ